MTNFGTVFASPLVIRTGRGIALNLGTLLQQRGVRKVMFVTDPGIAALKLDEPVRQSLAAAGIAVAVYDKVEADPPMTQALELIGLLKKDMPDMVIGFGGGSSIDLAKIGAVMTANDADLRDLVGINLVKNPGLPTLFMPTTAGTGSEATNISILNDVERQVKLGIVSEYMFADMVVIDPELTLSLPPKVTSWTGLDALIHAIEAFVSRAATPITDALAERSMQLIAKYLRHAYAVGTNMEARENMLTASLLAGMAFCNTQCGGAHACALAVGAKYHLAHGLATTLMLPATMEFNLIAAPEKYRRIAEIFGYRTKGLSLHEGAALAVTAVTDLAKSMDFVFGLENYGATDADVPGLAERSILGTRLWNSNPRPATLEQIEKILRRSFGDWPK
ncbi:iron-containing alcohol dehydrogenase [Desulfovibrio sp. OttesenSCG-928-O18]|nr:iron-containing alcohol dehydrogenase [Desulfovibrio sp. OttesenSCG-928-O18]